MKESMMFEPSTTCLSRGLVTLFVIISILLPGPLHVAGQRQSESRPSQLAQISALAPDKLLERELVAGQTHSYAVKLTAGELLYVTVVQRDIEVAVAIRDPDGKLQVEMPSLNGRLWREELSQVGEISGTYQVEVRAIGKELPRGSYSITLATPRTATARDRQRIEAERTLIEGLRFNAERSEPGKRKALQSFDKAAALWRELGESDWEAMTLTNAGWVHESVKNYEQATAAHTAAISIYQQTKDLAGESKSTAGLGLVNFSSRQFLRALGFYERSLALHRETKDRQGEAIILIQLGFVHESLDQPEKALNYYSQSLSSYRALAHRRGEANTLFDIGRLHESRGEWRKALDHYNLSLPFRRAIGDRAGEAIALGKVGLMYTNLGEYPKALDHYQESLPLLRTVGNQEDEVVTLTRMGFLYNKLDEQRKALDHYDKALPLARKIGDRLNEAVILSNIGLAYADLSEYQKALDYYNQALPLRRLAGDRSGEAATLNNIASVYYDLGERQKALDHFNQVLPLRKEVGDKRGEAITLNNIGAVYNASGERQKALDHYQLALSIYRTITDPSGEANTLSNIGLVYDDLGEHQKALEYYSQALPKRRAVGDRSGEATTLNNLGGVYHDLGEYQKALDYYSKALLLYQAIGDRSGEATSLSNIGGIYEDSGDPQKALDQFSKALAISRAIGDRASEAVALNNLGGSYNLLGEREKALGYFNQALKLYQSIGGRDGEASTLNNIGGVYNVLGDTAKALEYYDKALVLARANDDRSGEASMLSNLGTVYGRLGQRAKALEHYLLALPLQRAVGNRAGQATTLNNIGNLHYRAGEWQKALDYSSQALLLFREIGERRGEAITLGNIGDSYGELGQLDKALDHYSQSLTLSRAIGDRNNEATTLSNLMLFWREENQPRLATLYGKKAVNLYQSLRRDIQGLDKELQQTYLKKHEDTYRVLAQLLIKEGRVPEAELVLEMLKEEEYFQFVRRDDGVASALLKRVGLNETEANAIKRFDEHAERITSLGNEKAELEKEREQWLRVQPNSPFPRQARYAELEGLMADARRVFLLFLNELKREFGKRDERVVAVESSLQKDLRNWDDKNVAVVSAIVGEEQLNLIVTTGNTQRAHTVSIKAEKLNELIGEFRAALTSPRYDPRPAGQRLYDLLVKPIEVDLQGAGASLIVWSLDGALRYVPVAALYDQKHGYLAERYASTIITLASRTNLGAMPGDKKAWQALGAGVSQASTGFVALPAVPDELRGIVRDTAGSQDEQGVIAGRRLLDDQFTEASFKDSLGLRFPLVHIASHFRFSPGEDKDSFLLLGKGEQLTLDEVRLADTLFRGVELLTLSACNTATGNLKGDGSEIEGFGVIAQEQGAKAIMATLWPVADSSTRDLMVEFYKRFNANPKLSKAEAIQQAQLSLLRGTVKTKGSKNAVTTRDEIISEDDSRPEFEPNPAAPYSHPYYWAPFILIGNWR